MLCCIGQLVISYCVHWQWEVYLESYIQEAKWIASGHLPKFEEYFENGKVSSAYRAAALTPILTLDVSLPDYILKGIDFPSRFNDLASSFLRLRGDTRCYKVLPLTRYSKSKLKRRRNKFAH